METMTLLTRLCKVRDKLDGLEDSVLEPAFRADLTVEEVLNMGYGIVHAEDYEKLSAEIKAARKLVEDAIRYAARDLAEEVDE